MIVPIVIENSQDDYVVCPSPTTSVAVLRIRMLQHAKVSPGSYAYSLIDDLHAAIFEQSLDLKADYQAYFAREYETFAEYLHRRQRFPSAVVSTLAGAFDVSSGMYYFRPAYAFLTDAYGLEFLTRLLEDPPAGETS